MTPEMPNPLDPSLAFNMAPGDVELATGPQQPAAVFASPLQDAMVKPTQPQIPLHHENDKGNQVSGPDRDQVYHIRTTSKRFCFSGFQTRFRSCSYFVKIDNCGLFSVSWFGGKNARRH